jgi:hypothetical protein
MLFHSLSIPQIRQVFPQALYAEQCMQIWGAEMGIRYNHRIASPGQGNAHGRSQKGCADSPLSSSKRPDFAHLC